MHLAGEQKSLLLLQEGRWVPGLLRPAPKSGHLLLSASKPAGQVCSSLLTFGKVMEI